MKKFLMVGALAALAFVQQSTASTLIISSASFDFEYDGDVTLYDRLKPVGGNGDPAEADPVAAMTFTIVGDGVLMVLTSDIWIDMSLELDTPLLIGGTSNITGGFFDLLVGANNPAWGLALNVESGEVSIDQLDGALSVSAFGNASLCEGCVPNNTLSIIGPFAITFSSQSLQLLPQEGPVGPFAANGSADVSGTVIPEPSTYAMLGTALLGLGWLRRRMA